MAVFNESPQRGQSPDYTGASGGFGPSPTPNRGFEALFRGIGDIATGVAQAKDQRNVRNIEEGLYAAVDSVNAEFGIDSGLQVANQRVLSPTSTNLPPELQQSQDWLARLQQAWAAGTISETYYWNRLDVETRRIINQYPRYRSQIDQMVSSITGRIPANALRDSLMQEWDQAANAATANQTRFQTFVTQNLNDLPPDYFEKLESGTPYSETYIYDFVRNRQYQRQQSADTRARVETETALGNNASNIAQRGATAEAQTLVGNIINTTLVSATGDTMSSINSVISRLSNGSAVPQEELTALTDGFRTLRGQVIASIDAMFDQPLSEGSTDTYRTIINDPAKVEAIKEQALSQLAVIEQALFNKDYGLLHANANAAAAMQDATARQILEDHPIIRVIQGIAGISGGNEFISELMLNNPDFKNQVQAAVGQVATLRMFLPQAHQDAIEALGPEFKEMFNDGVRDPEVYAGTINNAIKALADPRATPDMVHNVARVLYGELNRNFLDAFDQEDRMKIFATLTSREITTKLAELRTTDPQTWDNYRRWSAQSFMALFQEEVGNVNIANGESVAVEITFDGTQFHVQPKDMPANSPARIINTWEYLQEEQIRMAQEAVREINIGLMSLAEILQHDNANVGEALSFIMQGMGFDPSIEYDPEKDPTLTTLRLTDMLGRAVESARETMVEESPETGKSPESNDPTGVEGENPDGQQGVPEAFNNLPLKPDDVTMTRGNYTLPDLGDLPGLTPDTPQGQSVGGSAVGTAIGEGIQNQTNQSSPTRPYTINNEQQIESIPEGGYFRWEGDTEHLLQKQGGVAVEVPNITNTMFNRVNIENVLNSAADPATAAAALLSYAEPDQVPEASRAILSVLLDSYSRAPITRTDTTMPTSMQNMQNADNIVLALNNDTMDGMTPPALGMLDAAAGKARELGVTIRVVGAMDIGPAGHLSHSHGTELDIKGVHSDGTPWTTAERVAIAEAAKAAGGVRFGFYPGGSLHMGLGYEGAPVNVAWGPGGRLSGVPTENFNKSEQDFVKNLRGF